jgi:general stress protein CsbA
MKATLILLNAVLALFCLVLMVMMISTHTPGWWLFLVLTLVLIGITVSEWKEMDL